MQLPNKMVIWLNQVRANFLVFAALLVLIGIALSFKYLPNNQTIKWFDITLVMIGSVLAHAAVNLFNEYSDHLTGIDKNTNRTPFSGESGMINSGFTNPSAVLFAAITILLIAVLIGIYFGITAHWSIFLIILIGGFSIIAYTPLLTKLMLGELFSGLTRGKGGRKHLVIKLGTQKAAYVYAAGVVATFVIILFLPLTGISSFWLYLGLLPLPIVIKATITALRYNSNIEKLIPALGDNIVTMLMTDALLAVSIFLTL